MANFYCLYNSKTTDSLNVQARLDSLEKSCNKRNIKFCLIDEATANINNLPIPTNQDGLYNCARGSFLLEQIMINKNVRTFYRNYNLLSQQDDSNLLCIELGKQGIPSPKTIYKGNNNKVLLKQYIEYLGGFPIIIKTYGGSGGVGVIKVDNYATLNSLADFLVSEKKEFLLKEFIPSSSCERVVVLGDEVIYNFSRAIKLDDFRSDVYDKRSKLKVLTDDVNKVAIQAAHAANYNYAGVDVIISEKDNKPYVLEVNCPQNFVINELLTGEDYSGKMIDWLFRSIVNS